MKRQLLIIACLAIAVWQATAQKSKPIVPALPETAGFSTERLKRIDNAMNEWVQKGWMNGGEALIVRDGKIVYYKAAGYDDLDAKTPLSKEGIFRIASQTKAITTVAIMILYEEGKLLLNDPVSKYIPSYRKQMVLDKFNAADTTYTTVPAARDITIKDLLTHTSGLGYAMIGTKESNAIYAKNKLTAGIGGTNESLLEAMTRLGTLPLMHQPGQKWTYGLNTDLLGCLVEIISGMTLNDFFRTRIFEPLGMKDTYFTIPKEKAGRLVNIYTEDQNGHLIKSTGNLLNGPVGPDYPLLQKTYYSGGAGLSSTIYDYAVFLQMLLNGGEYNGKRIISRNTVRMMTMNQIGEVPFRGDDKFGLGFEIVSEKTGDVPSQAGTFSWGGAYSTSYWADPKEKMVILFYRQLQRTTHWEPAELFRALAYQALND
ncbi:MAG: serine hydrolase domain-containing protein [Bacteroidota bacterium]|nr:serine hydrolase domain-containing protein [Bacteroidota bacterium]